MKPYRAYVFGAVGLNMLSAVFNIFSFSLIIPILQILFKMDTTQYVHIPWDSADLSLKELVINNFYAYCQELIASSGESRALLLIGLFFAAMTLVKCSSYFGASAIMIPLRTGVVRDLRTKVYDKLMGLPLGFFSNERKGDIVARMSGDVSEVENSIMSSLDMLLNAVGYPKPLTVSGYTSDFFGKDPGYYEKHPEYAEKFGVDDFAAAFVRLEGGIILDFRISWAMHMDTCGDALILGTKGGLRIPSTQCWNGEFDTPLTVYKNVAGQQTQYQVPLLPRTDMFYLKVRSFLDAIKNGTSAPVPTSQILYNQAIIDGIFKSNEIGHEVEINVPEV